jgi:hypothetical protein
LYALAATKQHQIEEFEMNVNMKNRTRIFALSTMALALASSTTYAFDQQDCDKIMGFSGHTRAELFPSTCEQTTAGDRVGGKTQEQVQAELAEAQKNGDIVVSFAAKPASELYPAEYPGATNLAQQGGGKTREQVKAELAEAQRNGDILVSFAARPARELHPGEYPGAAADLAQQGGGKTREQVKAELVAAKKAGSTVPAN